MVDLKDYVPFTGLLVFGNIENLILASQGAVAHVDPFILGAPRDSTSSTARGVLLLGWDKDVPLITRNSQEIHENLLSASYNSISRWSSLRSLDVCCRHLACLLSEVLLRE